MIIGHRQQAATRAAFFIAGFGMSAWAPLVPYAKARAGLDDAGLGLLLLCLGIGSLIAMPTAGALAGRFGCRALIVAASLCISAALPVLAIAEGAAAIAAALALFGAGVGMVDVAINIQAVIVEKASGRAMMSGFHGFFSIGGIAGAGGVSGLLWLGATPSAAALAVAAILLVILAAWGWHLLPAGGRDGGPFFAWPRGAVGILGILCFVTFLTEGAMLDWSAVFLLAAKATPAAIAGIGYASFSLAMTIGRLCGDRIVHALGGGRVLAIGGVCAALGFVAAVVAPNWAISLIGFAMIGFGCSNIVPVLFSLTGRQTIMPENLAVAAVSTMGYSGILLGPALIGFVSQATSLQTAWVAIGVGMLGVAASARVVRGLGNPVRPEPV